MAHQQWRWGSMEIGQRALWSALIVFGVLACSSRLWPGEDKGPQHGWWQGNGPVVSHESFPLDCMLCHTGKDWHTMREDFEFDHLAQTGVPLEGAHAAAQCLRCHNDRGSVTSFAAQGCAGCHVDVHEGKQGKACQDCHSQDNWNLLGAIMDHSRTRFPLVGAHAGTACRQCHVGIEVGNMEPLDVACESCHGGLAEHVLDPDHAALGWIQDCSECHRPTTWGGQGFIHTGFPLTGAHAQADCTQCHMGGVFGGPARDCVDCHQPEYDATTNPDHADAGFPTDCRLCHGATSWAPAQFQHNTFALTGSHRLLGCNQCHTGTVFAGLPSNCVDCHQSDYDNTAEPPHMAAGYATSCDDCHNTTAWDDAVLDHSSYPLTGAHVAINCSQCHVGAVFAGLPNNCVDCHLADYQGTTNPNHGAQGFSTACDGCHTTTMWNGAVFNHAFPIDDGDHDGFACTQCHLNIGSNDFSCTHCHDHRESEMDDKHEDENGYVWLTSACYSCHQNGEADDFTFRRPRFRKARSLGPGTQRTGTIRDLLPPRK